MASTPSLFVRVSTPAGHFSVPRAVADRADAATGWRVLKQPAVGKDGRPLPPKLREKRRPTKPRDVSAAATHTPEPETVSGDTTEESA